jgi:hypothetical protein
MKQALIALLAYCAQVAAQESEDKIGFAFEIVRHGARNTYVNGWTDGFSVGKAMLTPQGMGQRYLLGRYARDRYVSAGLLDPDFKQGQVYC